MAAKPPKMPKVAKVKDKSPAEIQITAEQLLREAKERELEIVPPPARQKISDSEELREYRLKKRRAFEDNIRKNRQSISNWLKYAKWEEEQSQIQRARSVYERALDVDHRAITLWLRYAEMEMRSRQVNHARNIWDRAVTIMPRANQFWYKYTYMEETLKNVSNARQVFERWMEWEPDEQAWMTYVKFELRYKELDRARAIYERFVIVHPDPKYWIKYARFEENHNYIGSARRVYERAIEFFGDDHMDENLYIAFAKFEEKQREYDRAKAIFKYALDKLPKEKSLALYNEYTKHEKKFGDKSSIDDVITSKRRFQYEALLKEDCHDYDTWFDYIKMLEADGNADLIRAVYERAIAALPLIQEKAMWRRYIYLWIYYALYEEFTAKDIERARDVYKMCLKVIPHKMFTFAEIWLLYAKFEIRQKDLAAARKSLGTAIGMCAKNKLFRGYINLETKLRELDRCRVLYEKWLAFDMSHCQCWIDYATFEDTLEEVERARGIFEIAVSQSQLDMPELLWKTYIDFEVQRQEYDRVRQLYNRLLERTSHVKVWISYAKFENSTPPEEDSTSRARAIYKQANDILRQDAEKQQRIVLLESWKEFEQEYGTEETICDILKIMPRKITRRHKVTNDDGSQMPWREVEDFIFPDDEAAKPSLLLIARAKQWKEHAQQPSHQPDEAPIKDEPLDPHLDRDSDVQISSDEESDHETPAKRTKFHPSPNDDVR